MSAALVLRLALVVVLIVSGAVMAGYAERGWYISVNGAATGLVCVLLFLPWIKR